MELIAPARDAVKAACAVSPDVDAQRALELANIRLGIENLRSYPFVARAETAGKLKLHGVIFDIAEGALRVLDDATGQFQPVAIAL
jgi:carbonic anhydrase